MSKALHFRLGLWDRSAERAISAAARLGERFLRSDPHRIVQCARLFYLCHYVLYFRCTVMPRWFRALFALLSSAHACDLLIHQTYLYFLRVFTSRRAAALEK